MFYFVDRHLHNELSLTRSKWQYNIYFSNNNDNNSNNHDSKMTIYPKIQSKKKQPSQNGTVLISRACARVCIRDVRCTMSTYIYLFFFLFVFLHFLKHRW